MRKGIIYRAELVHFKFKTVTFSWELLELIQDLFIPYLPGWATSPRSNNILLEYITRVTRRALGGAHTSDTQCLIHENTSGPINFWNIMWYVVFGPISQWWRITFKIQYFSYPDLDLHQNRINLSLSHTQPVHQVSSESVHNFLRYPAH